MATSNKLDSSVCELLSELASYPELRSHSLASLSSLFSSQSLFSSELVCTLTPQELDILLKNFSLGAKKRAWIVLQQWSRQQQALRGGSEDNFGSSTDASEDEEEERRVEDPEEEQYLRAEIVELDPDRTRDSKKLLEMQKTVNVTMTKRKHNNVKSSNAVSPDLIARHTATKSTTTSPSHSGNNVLMFSACTSKRVVNLEPRPETWKTLVAFLYALLVSWLTAFVMVVVHDRVPDMETYPPLPDLLLDNLPHIPWAFEMAEVSVMVLFWLWMITCFFHKHRFVLLRRFFSLGGTIFLLRCITMLLTSLSVPGRHLECSPRVNVDVWHQVSNAYLIWTGAGLSIKGVRSCGDYMFSGHTVALTLLNFFITEYTSRRIYFLHTFAWICNLFGIFFILAAHEHYSIDVFVAFYISSRLFLYYHTLANNNSGSRRSKKSWFHFPLFHFFEANVEAKVPNDFECPITMNDIKNTFNASARLLMRKDSSRRDEGKVFKEAKKKKT